MNPIARLKASRSTLLIVRLRASRYLAWFVITAATAACSSGPQSSASAEAPARPVSPQQIPIGQLPNIDIDALLQHTKVLSSDEYEGRAPGTKGEELSVKYISDEFKKIGLKPGNPDGAYTQEVPLAGIKSESRMSFIIGDKTIDLK